MQVLAIDPGTRCVGWSMWDEKLESCGLVRTKKEELGERAHDLASQLPFGSFHMVVELPRIYPYERRKRPNDIVDLAYVGGVCSFRGASLSTVTPAQWKGQLPKAVSHRRVIEGLDQQELLIVKDVISKVPKTLKHNVLDALGIGQWWSRNG